MAGLFVISFLLILVFWDCYADYSRCRVSSRGTEYKGTLSKSHSGADCLFWDAVKEMKGEDYIDYRFPDGSKTAARNYCRNPSMESTGPWCYVLENELKKELCSIPFCFFSDCRWTGPGEEYNGTISKTISTEHCTNWSTTKYSEKTPSICLNDSSPCGSCRNFDSTFSGPWCMAADQKGNFEKQFCDIPFCQLAPVIINTGVLSDTGPITTFHKITNDSGISLKVRLWDPNEWLTGQIGVLVSIFDIPATSKEIVKWQSGIFFTMGNVGSMIVAQKVFDHIQTQGILSSMQWTNLTISWKRSSENFMVYVHVNENRKPLLVADVKTNNTYLDKKSFQYFSVLGVKSFWDFSTTPDSCLVTTTSFGNKSLWYLIERDFGQAVETIYLKTYDVAVVAFRESFSDGDLLRIHIAKIGQIVVEEVSEETVVVISEVTISPFDFSTWAQINITVIGDSFLVTRVLESHYEVAANLTKIPRNLLWFGISSESVSYWSVNCNPEGETVSRTITLDCSSSSSEFDYKGFNKIAASGKFCAPWIDERIPIEYQNMTLFNQFGGILNSVNYCRNLDFDRTGAFCFVADQKNNFEKQKCLIPPCAMEDCKLSGTGTDYSGKLAKTRSGRVCRNYTVCRNPNKNIGGPWCETDDPFVGRDFCMVRDCEWHSSEIMLFSQTSINNFYILPHWKKSGLHFWIKNWDPENDAVLCITMKPLSKSPVYKLIIGGGSNEDIVLKFVDENSDSILLKETASHIIKSGKWTGFWLRCGLGHVELGYEKKARPFFDWESGSTEDQLKFQPMFFNFGTLNNFWLGVRFQPIECIVENLIGNSSQIWPINLWKNDEDSKTVDFYLQGDGNFSIHFFQVPEAGIKLSLLIHYTEISIIQSEGSTVKTQNSSVLADSMIKSETWTKMTLRCAENYVRIEIADQIILELTTQIVLLLYWFKIECISGTLAWSANCEPLELAGEARDGGWGDWSPWSCSAPCGGGEGFRERFCNNPRPNLLGKECAGMDVYRGPCNTFPCGDAPPELLQQIRKRLASDSLSIVAQKGSQVRFSCNEDLAAIFLEHVPKMFIEWVLNGFVSVSPRASANNFSLELNATEHTDSGVWVCLANWQVGDEDKSTVLSVISLIVTSQYPTSMVRETSSFNLNCNSVVLGQIYSQLSLKWILNDLVWADFGSTILEGVEIQIIHDANKSHSGVWTCVVSQDELGLTWKTAWINLQVDPAPNFWSYLIQDDATSLIFSGMAEQTAKIVFIACFLLILVLPIILIFILKALSKEKPLKRVNKFFIE